jgi:V8-like Glu-specific endopeptidase
MKLQFSIKDNKLLALKDRFVHYRAPTQGGSSGSPVFNEFWELIALHHAGGFNVPKLDGDGVYAANEGISILSIVEQIRSSLAA